MATSTRIGIGTALVTVVAVVALTPGGAGGVEAGKANTRRDYVIETGSAKWDSCRTIRWRLNRNGVATAERERLKAAFRSISAATDLRFRYEGRTTKIPLRRLERPNYDDRADITVGFAAPGRKKSQAPVWRQLGASIGVGGPQYDHSRILRGAVLFRTPFVRVATPDQRLSLYLHELGHVIGLGHARGEQQIMHPMDQGVVTWGRGDLTGLKRLGSGHRPC